MRLIKRIVDTEKLGKIIELPESFKKREIEILVLPIKDERKRERKRKKQKNIIQYLIENPLEIEGFKPFKRNEIYER